MLKSLKLAEKASYDLQPIWHGRCTSVWRYYVHWRGKGAGTELWKLAALTVASEFEAPETK